MGYFEDAQRYEVMSEVAKLLQPFYEDARDAKVCARTHTHTHTHTHTSTPLFIPSPSTQSMMEMYGKLHQAYRKIVDIKESGRRYLGTYFRVGFYGRVCKIHPQ